MKDNVFLDTNILVYAYSATELDKQTTARKLITEKNSFISTQVLQELTHTVTRKFGFRYTDAVSAVSESCRNNNVHVNTTDTVYKACEIADAHRFSFYDSLIIAAALECHCAILYSEDLRHNQRIENKLTLINPFG